MEKRTVTVKGLKVGGTDNEWPVDVTISPLTEPEDLQGMVAVLFADAAAPVKVAASLPPKRGKDCNVQLANAEQELRRVHEELQNTREEMQTSQEELKSANEELQSTNEELQSTNEELTTSKEEMQSMNEELQTLNHELQAKVTDLSLANSDLRNLLDSTDIATLFLDADLHIRRFTAQMAKIIKLIPGDAGRPITDITSELDYPELAEDAQEVLRTLIFKEKTVSGSSGRSFLVKIMPYRTLENRIDGLVITFLDITVSKTLEKELRQAQAELEKRLTSKEAKLKDTQVDLRKEVRLRDSGRVKKI